MYLNGSNEEWEFTATNLIFSEGEGCSESQKVRLTFREPYIHPNIGQISSRGFCSQGEIPAQVDNHGIVAISAVIWCIS